MFPKFEFDLGRAWLAIRTCLKAKIRRFWNRLNAKIELLRRRSLKWWIAFWSHVPTAFVTVFYLFGCWQLAELLALAKVDLAQKAQMAFWLIFCLLGWVFIVVHFVDRCFRRRAREGLLLTIVTSYLALILLFAGLYYVLCAFWDGLHVHTVFDHYQRMTEQQKGRKIGLISSDLVVRRRAFQGIEARLFTGLDRYAPGKPEDQMTEKDYLDALSQPNGERLFEPRFEPQNRIWVFLDCFHLSVMTMTTTGYGDIVPIQWASKLATDVQALAGVALVVFALGMMFGNWWHPPTVEKLRERLETGEISYDSPVWQSDHGELKSVSKIRIERARDTKEFPACPFCTSKNVIPFAELFPLQPEPRRNSFNEACLTAFCYVLDFLALLPLVAIGPYLPAWFYMMDLFVFGMIITLLFMYLPQLMECFYKSQAAKRLAKYRRMQEKWKRSWSCAVCRGLFIEDFER